MAKPNGTMARQRQEAARKALEDEERGRSGDPKYRTPVTPDAPFRGQQVGEYWFGETLRPRAGEDLPVDHIFHTPYPHPGMKEGEGRGSAGGIVFEDWQQEGASGARSMVEALEGDRLRIPLGTDPSQLRRGILPSDIAERWEEGRAPTETGEMGRSSVVLGPEMSKAYVLERFATAGNYLQPFGGFYTTEGNAEALRDAAERLKKDGGTLKYRNEAERAIVRDGMAEVREERGGDPRKRSTLAVGDPSVYPREEPEEDE